MKNIHEGKIDGRPRIEIDFDLLKNLCMIQCTAEEISAVMDISSDTLTERIKEKYNCTFPEYIKTIGSSGRASLRRMQWKSATNGSVPMQIFLSKNYLGMRDMPEKEQNDNVSEALRQLAEKLK
jgi:hypothetical protein